MAHTHFTSIPLIDVSGLYSEHFAERQRVAEVGIVQHVAAAESGSVERTPHAPPILASALRVIDRSR